MSSKTLAQIKQAIFSKTEEDKIIDFIIRYTTYTDREKIREVIRKHLEYNTCMVIYGGSGEIAAVARWNISSDGRIAEILDVVLAPKYRKKGILRRMLLRGWQLFPTVTHIKWKVGHKRKFAKGETFVVPIRKLLKRNF